jgi:hypothetical protein
VVLAEKITAGNGQAEKQTGDIDIPFTKEHQLP